jgi:type IX secretion system protein PorV
MPLMRHTQGAIGVILLLLAAATIAARGQGTVTDVSKTATNAAVFLEIPVGAAAIGMGGAFVSIANDATSLYWNPAGSAALVQNQFVAVHTGWIAGTRFDFGGFVLPLGGFGTLGASFTSLSMDDMKVRTVEQPEGTGEFFSAGDMAAGISYSRRLTDRFGIGFTVKYIRQSIWHESAEAFALDAGTTFKTDLFGGMTIGATLTNFGTNMQLSGRDTRTFIRLDPSKQGSSDKVPTDIEMESWNLPLLLQFGVSTDVLKNESTRWTVAADALHPSDDYESMNIGTEFAVQDYLFLRGGYQSLFLTDHEGGLSLGIGVASSSLIGQMVIKFDYAYRDMGRLESVHTFSVAAQF